MPSNYLVLITNEFKSELESHCAVVPAAIQLIWRTLFWSVVYRTSYYSMIIVVKLRAFDKSNFRPTVAPARNENNWLHQAPMWLFSISTRKQNSLSMERERNYISELCVYRCTRFFSISFPESTPTKKANKFKYFPPMKKSIRGRSGALSTFN